MDEKYSFDIMVYLFFEQQQQQQEQHLSHSSNMKYLTENYANNSISVYIDLDQVRPL